MTLSIHPLRPSTGQKEKPCIFHCNTSLKPPIHAYSIYSYAHCVNLPYSLGPEKKSSSKFPDAFIFGVDESKTRAKRGESDHGFFALGSNAAIIFVSNVSLGGVYPEAMRVMAISFFQQSLFVMAFLACQPIYTRLHSIHDALRSDRKGSLTHH